MLRRGEHEASGETDLALRYDLTVPLARVVAEHRGKLPRFFKRYQIQPVWRADRPARGRFREFYQCDVDAIGSRSLVVEVGSLRAAVSDVLRALGFTDFVLRLNHRGCCAGMLDASGVPEPLHDQALVALDKLDKIGARRRATRNWRRRGVEAAAGRASARRAFCRRSRRGDDRLLGAWQVGDRPAGAGGAGRTCAEILELCRGDERRRRTCSSIRAWRAACRTTPARSWRLPFRIWPAASAAADATTG